jgi:hypothetical protein
MNMATMNKPSASNATLPWTARLDLQVVFFALLRNHHARQSKSARCTQEISAAMFVIHKVDRGRSPPGKMHRTRIDWRSVSFAPAARLLALRAATMILDSPERFALREFF